VTRRKDHPAYPQGRATLNSCQQGGTFKTNENNIYQTKEVINDHRTKDQLDQGPRF
jgi:hypothetical protein